MVVRECDCMNKRNTRDIGLQGTGAGKGDADRSPKWRDHYDEIDWPSGGKSPRNFRKIYGSAREPMKLEDLTQ
jgi:hypothetical protein